MIDELEDLLTQFAGQAGRTRCFAHIINLIVKSVLQQFDVPKLKRTHHDAMGDAIDALSELVEGLNVEEQLTMQNDHSEVPEGGDEDASGDDNTDGWVDEWERMSPEVLDELEANVLPVQCVLAKVRSDLELILSILLSSLAY
jgi:hypothetical protein